VIKTKTGNVKGVLPGGVVGSEYLQPGATDPYQWVNKILIPALAKKGITDPSKIQEVIAAMSSQTTTAQMMTIFATQQARIEKDQHLVEHADGKDSAAKFQANDPKVIAKSIHSQFDNLLANTTEGAMPAANAGMNWLASGLSWAAEHAKTRPGDTLAGGLWGGAMLSAMGADGAGKMLEYATGKGGSLGLTKAVAAMAPLLALPQLADALMDDDDIKRLRKYEASPRSRFDQLAALDGSSGWGPERDESGRMKNPGMLDRWLWPENDGRVATRARLEKELEGFGYNPAVTSGRYQAGGPGWSIDDIRKATGIGGGSSEPVKAEVVGEATLKTEVTVSPSPDFLARVQQTVQNGINAFRASGGPATGTAGSAGTSMPEAGPPQ
jgi:hypothetical protein